MRYAPKPKLLEKLVEMKQPKDLGNRVTAASDLFSIAHMAVADVADTDWQLTVSGMVDSDLRLSLKDLKQLPSKSVETIHKCSGYPYAPTVATRQVANVYWTGVDLLELSGALGVSANATHLWAYGAEYGEFIGVAQDHYVKDIPRWRIEEGDVLVAYELNHAPLTLKHGAPARLVVPGFYGTNCVKWLCRLEYQDRRADGMFTRVLYNDRDLIADPSGHTVKPVWEVDPESIIVWPTSGETLSIGEMEVWGWAWSHCPVRSVQVSVDGGRLWSEATVESRREYSWQKFSFPWTPSEVGQVEIMVRAEDDDGVRQPMSAARNSVHSITVDLVD